MEQMVNVIVNNGLGVASFLALLIFMYKYMNKMETTLTKISDTLTLVQTNLLSVNNRLDEVEHKLNKED